MPLSFLRKGQVGKVTSIVGNDEIKAHLKDLGFVLGADISVVNELAGNIIVNVKESRVAIDRNLANKIMVD
ncbi:MAG: FeoA family protein [Erysipelotrichaceae bacterium]|nr:FeoA family protein [Erysipelotrichaceae bacterium]